MGKMTMTNWILEYCVFRQSYNKLHVAQV
jgi:hypothetical protein